jgi:hypothetical protein
MKTLSTIQQGITGGGSKMYKIGYVAMFTGNDKTISIDNFSGRGEEYKQRDQPIVCIFDGQNCIFEGTHEQLIQKLTK